MTNKVKPLSDTQRTLPTVAATHHDHLVRMPRLAVAAARQVIRSMLNAALVVEVPDPNEDANYAWRTDDDGSVLVLRATALGLARVYEVGGVGARATSATIGVPTVGNMVVSVTADAAWDATDAASMLAVPGPGEAAQRSPAPATRTGRHRDFRRAAEAALLEARDGLAGGDADACQPMGGPLRELRIALASATSGKPASQSSRRETKRSQVLVMLRRREGASGPQIAEATGWAAHTVRGFLAGLAKKGITIEVLERVRQVGPGSLGARGSYTVYRLSGEVGE